MQRKREDLQFNFELFKTLAACAYKKVGDDALSLAEVLNIFEYYFRRYELHNFSDCPFDPPDYRVHPNIRARQIEHIIALMPYVSDPSYDDIIDLGVGDYEEMIDKHFRTKYMVGRGVCDFNINHFFSGNIRVLRYYEMRYYES